MAPQVTDLAFSLLWHKFAPGSLAWKLLHVSGAAKTKQKKEQRLWNHCFGYLQWKLFLLVHRMTVMLTLTAF